MTLISECNHSSLRKLVGGPRWQAMILLAVEEQLLPGQVILGRFRLERLLGRGGMGTVWEAHHLSLQTQIAIKFLNADLSRRHDVLARFAREATSAARIRSAHVVSILDSGFTDDGHGFIAMELLRGEDLGRRLARFGKLTTSETAALVTQIARGLTKAHAVSVVHRDLKPENIFIVDEDDAAFSVKILDFGIAKSIGPEASTHKTDTGQLLGTPLYMSPEQALGRSIDSRSDLYSLAVVAYRCLTGRLPFMFGAVGELIVAVSTHAPPAPSEFNAELTAAIDDWFAGMLVKDPARRSCQTANELAESFNRACGEAAEGPFPSDLTRGTTSRQSFAPPRSDGSEPPIPSREEVATTIAAAQGSLGQRSEPPVRARLPRALWPALAALLIAAAAGSAFRHRSRRAEPKPRAVLARLDAARPVDSAGTATTATLPTASARALVASALPNHTRSELAAAARVHFGPSALGASPHVDERSPSKADANPRSSPADAGAALPDAGPRAATLRPASSALIIYRGPVYP